MPKVDFTLEDVRHTVREEIAEERSYTRAMVHEVVGAEVNEAKSELMAELDRTRRMLSEDILAESGRLDKTNRRLDRHIASRSLHAQS